MNLESIALRRSEEMLSRGAWKKPDAGEQDAPVLCMRCGAPVFRRSAGVCHECSKLGYRGTPCVSCGGVTHKRDRANQRALMRGMCGDCRKAAREAASVPAGWDIL